MENLPQNEEIPQPRDLPIILLAQEQLAIRALVDQLYDRLKY